MCCPLAIAAADGSNVGRSRRGGALRRAVPRDILRRVRWVNVSLALAAAGALAGVILWPLAGAPTPSLPPDLAKPLVSDTPPAAVAGSGHSPARATRRHHAKAPQ